MFVKKSGESDGEVGVKPQYLEQFKHSLNTYRKNIENADAPHTLHTYITIGAQSPNHGNITYILFQHYFSSKLTQICYYHLKKTWVFIPGLTK